LATYIALSAWRIASCASTDAPLMSAMPMLAVTTRESSPGNGFDTLSSTRSASCSASPCALMPSAMTTNSSPPIRPTKSLARTVADRRSPTSRSISSARL